MMKRVGIVSFHGAYNYGSVLLTYALQRALEGLGVEASVIDYRPVKQRSMYRLPILVGKSWVKRMMERILWIPYVTAMREKQARFDTFRRSRLAMTPAIAHISQIEDVCGVFDYVMAGGDQIWNPGCHEFEWFYFLDFVAKGKKVAFAPSMAGGAEAQLPVEIAEHIRRAVATFAKVGVRDTATCKFLGATFPVIADPVFLFDCDFWSSLIAEDAKSVNGQDYILFYDPFDDVKAMRYVKQVARTCRCKVVNTNLYKVFDVNHCCFDYTLETGPVDFLKLIRDACLCVGRSFHLAAFCLIFRKPCHIVNGMLDVRVRELVAQLLPQKGGEGDLDIIENDYDEEFECRLCQYRETAWRFLKECVEI